MKFGIILLAALTTLFGDVALAQPAGATKTTAPILSGTYIVQITTLCQATMNTTVSPVDGDVGKIVVSVPGDLEIATGTFNFDQSTGQATASLFNVDGAIILFNGQGKQMASDPEAFSGAYSTTSTSFSVFGLTFKASYGKVNSLTHVAEFVIFNGVGGVGSACVNSGIGIRQ